jgi:hypothetical protein
VTRAWTAALAVAISTTVVAAADQARGARGARGTAQAPAATEARCAAELGTGVKSKRTFCDVLIASTPADSIAVTIPAHRGPATLQFDLHNRFAVPAVMISGPLVFQRHDAIVAVIRANGQVISRAAVVREFRRMDDLFDQVGGGTGPAGTKSVAPGPAEPIRVTIPAGVTAFGIVGVRLEVLRRTGEETFDAPGRPVAVISNLRVEWQR